MEYFRHVTRWTADPEESFHCATFSIETSTDECCNETVERSLIEDCSAGIKWHENRKLFVSSLTEILKGLRMSALVSDTALWRQSLKNRALFFIYIPISGMSEEQFDIVG